MLKTRAAGGSGRYGYSAASRQDMTAARAAMHPSARAAGTSPCRGGFGAAAALGSCPARGRGTGQRRPLQVPPQQGVPCQPDPGQPVLAESVPLALDGRSAGVWPPSPPPCRSIWTCPARRSFAQRACPSPPDTSRRGSAGGRTPGPARQYSGSGGSRHATAPSGRQPGRRRCGGPAPGSWPETPPPCRRSARRRHNPARSCRGCTPGIWGCGRRCKKSASCPKSPAAAPPKAALPCPAGAGTPPR